MTIPSGMVFYSICVALHLLGPVCSLSSHSPPDPFSYPKYSVNLFGWNDAIDNLTATAILNDVQSDAHDGSLVNPISFSQNDEPDVRHTLMRTASGQAFLCALPPIPTPPSAQNSHPSHANAADSPSSVVEDLERKKERERIEQEGLKNGLNLISSLKDRCIYTRLGWFTYSFCYGKGEIRQFHAQIVPGYNSPQEDPNQDVYVLGFHLDHPQNPHHQARLEGTLPAPTLSAGEGELTSLGRNRFSSAGGSIGSISDILRDESAIRSSSVKEEEEFQQKRYLVQRWDGGTICDMTGKPRTVEVQFHCSTLGSDHIALLRETTICEYLLVIHTPRLCSEPLFLDGGSRKGIGAGDMVTNIGCKPVLTDEEIEKWKAAENTRQKKKQEDENAHKLKSLEEAASDQETKTESKKTDNPESSADSTHPSASSEKASSVSQNQDESIPISPPDQTVLGGAQSTTDQTTGKENTESAGEKPDEKRMNSKDKGGILEVEPITVYFDTNSGKVYVDNPTAERQSSGTGNNNQASNSEQQTTERKPTDGDSGAEFQEIAKALKDSLKALLKDLRGDEEGNNEAGGRLNNVNNNRNNQARPKSLGEILASLKELDPSSGGTIRNSRLSTPNDHPKNPHHPAKTSWEDIKKISTESHSKLVEMYQQKFDFPDDSKSDQDSVDVPTTQNDKKNQDDDATNNKK